MTTRRTSLPTQKAGLSRRLRASLNAARKRRLSRRRLQQTSVPAITFAALDELDGLFNSAVATFTSISGWPVEAGLTYDTSGFGKASVLGVTTSKNLQRSMLPLDPARTYALHAACHNVVAGRLQFHLRDGGGNQVAGSNRYLGAHHIQIHSPANPNTTFRVALLSQGGNPQLDVLDAQIVDVTDQLAKPKAIILEFGQSNRVGAFGVSGYDPELDRPEFRAFMVPTMEATAIGAYTDNSGSTYGLSSPCGIGEPTIAASVLPHATSAQTAFGASPAVMPALSEAKHLCDNWPTAYADHVPTFLLSGATASSLFTEWDHESGPQGNYLRLMKANIDALLAANPESFILGAVWQQGEADLSSHAIYAAKFSGMIAELRGLYGEFPLVIAEIGGLVATGGTQLMIDAQKKLASNSGDPAALTKCAYVARPAGADNTLLEDEGGAWIHFRADTNRAMGTSIGAALVQLLATE